MKSPNLPQKTIEDVAPSKVHEIVSSLRQLYDEGKPETDAEVADRIDRYFQLCQDSSIRPGIESISAALHISRVTFFNWSKGIGCDKKRQELILTARSFIDSFIEQCMLQGQINPASAIFLAKNWMGYRDTISLEEAAPKQTAPPPVSSEQIAAKYGLSETNLQDYEMEAFNNDNY